MNTNTFRFASSVLTFSLLFLGWAIGVTGESDSLQKGLVAHFPFEGNLQDVSGNQNHANPVKGDMGYVKGPIGKALALDGRSYATGSIRKFPLGRSERTLCLWVQTNDAEGEFDGDQSPNFLFGWGDFKKGGDSYGILEDGAPWIVSDCWYTFTREDKQLDGHDVSFTQPANGEWQFLCSMYRNGQVVHFVNGVEINSATVEIGTQGGQFYIGTSPLKGRYNFKGAVDDVRIYDRALQADEIQWLYQLGIQEKKE